MGALLRATDMMLWAMPGHCAPELCRHLLFAGPVLSWKALSRLFCHELSRLLAAEVWVLVKVFNLSYHNRESAENNMAALSW